MFAVRCKAIGEHASSRAGADDDVVKFQEAVIGLHQRLAVCSRQDLGRLDGGINTVWTATAFIRGIDCIAEFRTQSDSAILNSYSDRAVSRRRGLRP
jgi:hypothetical protein